MTWTPTLPAGGRPRWPRSATRSATCCCHCTNAESPVRWQFRVLIGSQMLPPWGAVVCCGSGSDGASWQQHARECGASWPVCNHCHHCDDECYCTRQSCRHHRNAFHHSCHISVNILAKLTYKAHGIHYVAQWAIPKGALWNARGCPQSHTAPQHCLVAVTETYRAKSGFVQSIPKEEHLHAAKELRQPLPARAGCFSGWAHTADAC